MPGSLHAEPRPELEPQLLFVHSGENALGNAELPIALQRHAIEQAIRRNSVTLIVAPTGSGKTTQVPQYACELSMGGTPMFNEIIVTQPRIVAARSVSQRVADEIKGANRNHPVGYYTSKEATPDPQRNQDIAFLTDGKAAAQLLHNNGGKRRAGNKLLIIDEVHEWNPNIEMLVALATEKTDPKSKMYDPDLKVVIMSATMEAAKLKDHFAHVDPPIIEVDVPTYEVTSSVSNNSVADVALKIAKTGGKVLAFHAGKREIANTAIAIAKRQHPNDEQMPVIPLHGQLTAKQQKKAFEEYPTGAVVATTNVAETSLTVPDAIAVVDSGETRVDRRRYDYVRSGSEGLYLEDAAQANLAQRRGRVGRTGPGDYILASQTGRSVPTPIEHRPEHMTPAIQRSSLDSFVLQLKASGHEISDFRFFHTPPEEALQAAHRRLQVLGALDEKGIITERGLKMERLPLEPEFACMLVFAQERGYNNDVKKNLLDIVAIMQLGGIVKKAPKEQRWKDLLSKDYSGIPTENESDYFAQLEVYVELTQHIKKAQWQDYDIIEYSAEHVEQERASLARHLKQDLHQVVTVAPSNRQAVLACINAGQLNQLWRQYGEGWSLVFGVSPEYSLSQSSVVTTAGRLVTGSLFTLGVRGDTFSSVQNVNAVPNKDMLELVASHLIKEVPTNEKHYDAKRGVLVERVQRKLGPLVLRVVDVEIRDALNEADAAIVRAGHSDFAWNNWPEAADKRVLYELDTIDEAITDPVSMQYGVDPVTNAPLLAFRGAKGWCRTKEIAVQSLEAYKTQLVSRPQKLELARIKDEIRLMRPKLVAIKNTRGHAKAIEAKELLKKVTNEQSWLDMADQLVNGLE